MDARRRYGRCAMSMFGLAPLGGLREHVDAVPIRVVDVSAMSTFLTEVSWVSASFPSIRATSIHPGRAMAL